MTVIRPGRLSQPTPAAGVVDRPRLLDRLGARPVTVVAGMAGFGKSTLLSSWLSSRPRRGAVAWLTLDASDHDPQRLVSDIRAALAACGEPAMRAAVEPLQVPPALPDPLRWLDVLVEGLYGAGVPLTLVLDDVQNVQSDAAALAVLDYLLRWAPTDCAVVLSARVVPRLRLQRLRLDGRLEVLTHTDLAFTPEETDAVIRAAGVGWGQEWSAQIHRVTSGWPAGVQMALLAQRGRGDGESSVMGLPRSGALADYLAGEVLASLDEQMRDFVLEATVDDHVCGPLVDAVRGSADAGRLLERCVESGLFLTRLERSEEVVWYGWHRLFAAHMRRHHRFETPERARSGRVRAAQWWRSLDPSTAIEHAIGGEDPEAAGDIFAEAWLPMVLQGRAKTVLRLGETLPDTVATAAEVHLARALVHAEAGRLDVARLALAAARGARDRLPEAHRTMFAIHDAVIDLFLVTDHQALEEAVLAARGVLARIVDDLPTVDAATLALAQLCVGVGEARLQRDPAEALRCLRAASATARGAALTGIELNARAEACLVAASEGDLDAVETQARAVLDVADARGWHELPGLAPAVGYLGWLAFWRGEPARARSALSRALLLARPTDWGARGQALYFRARAAVMAGDVAAARADLVTAGDLADPALVPHWWSGWLDGLAAAIHLAAGEMDEAEELLARPLDGRAHRLVPIDRAAVLLALKRPEESLACLDLVPSAERYPQVATWAAVVQAQALSDLKDVSGAHRAVEDALSLAAPARLLGPLLLVGQVVAPLLRDHLRRGTAHPELLTQALNRLAADHPGRGTEWGEQLTERERVVLRYLSTNLTNAEIAAAEFISVHTAKTHIGHIYRKLGVSNRRAAIRRAAELQLL